MSADRLTGLDSSFLHMERAGAHMHVASAMHLRGPGAHHDEFRDHIASRLHLVPRFRQKLRFVPFDQGRPVWVDDPHLNLDYHVRQTALPAPGSEEQLRNLAARIFSQQLDRSKPLWELWLVEGLDDGRFAIIGKSHHAWSTASPGVDITTVLFDLEQEPANPPAPPPKWAPRPEPTDLQLLGDALRERATSPREIVRGVRAALRGRARCCAGIGDTSKMVGAGMAAPATPLQRRDRPPPPARLRAHRPRRRSSGSRTSTAARSTTSSSRSSPGRSATTCGPAATTPRASRCGRWCRSASAPRKSAGRSATASRR